MLIFFSLDIFDATISTTHDATSTNVSITSAAAAPLVDEGIYYALKKLSGTKISCT